MNCLSNSCPPRAANARRTRFVTGGLSLGLPLGGCHRAGICFRPETQRWEVCHWGFATGPESSAGRETPDVGGLPLGRFQGRLQTRPPPPHGHSQSTPKYPQSIAGAPQQTPTKEEGVLWESSGSARECFGSTQEPAAAGCEASLRTSVAWAGATRPGDGPLFRL